MLKKRGIFSFFTNKFSSLNRHEDLDMVYYSTCNDVFFKGFHSLQQPQSNSVDSLKPAFLARNLLESSNGSRIDKRIGFLRVNNCSDSHNRAFAQHHQLVREFEESSGNATKSVAWVNTNGSSHGGKLLGFPDYPVRDKIMVAVDVDEVLGNFVSALNIFIADRYSSIHSVSEYHVYEFFKIWNCSRDEADIRVHEFFKTPYFKQGIYPIPGAQKALHKLSRLCKLSVVTSRQNVIKDHTLEWLENHYSGLFQEIHFGNHFALDGESKPKSEICRSLGANVLIDDNPRYAMECAAVGIRVLLFDYEKSYPWAKMEPIQQHPLITTVHNWEQVEQQLVSLIVS